MAKVILVLACGVIVFVVVSNFAPGLIEDFLPRAINSGAADSAPRPATPDSKTGKDVRKKGTTAARQNGQLPEAAIGSVDGTVSFRDQRVSLGEPHYPQSPPRAAYLQRRYRKCNRLLHECHSGPGGQPTSTRRTGGSSIYFVWCGPGVDVCKRRRSEDLRIHAQ